MASRHQRAKRAEQRAGQAQPSAHLAPHSARCECPGCEEKRKKDVAIAQVGRDRRARRDHDGATVADFRADWRVSLHRLVEYFEMHEVTMRKRHVTHVDLRPEWLGYLSAHGPRGRINDAVLYDAFFVLEHITPLYGRLLRGWRGGTGGRTQAELAEQECMSRQAVQRALDAAEDHLEDLYRALLAREQARLVATG